VIISWLLYDEWICDTQFHRQESVEDQDESPPSSPTVNLIDNQFADCDSPPPQLIDLTSSNLVDQGSQSYCDSYYYIEFYIDDSESDSEPDLELWDEGEDILLRDTEQPPDPISSNTSFDDILTSSRGLANWILRFIRVMQAAFRLPDVVICYFLQFFAVLFGIIGQH
jgi:hypothetical protein